MSNRVIAVDYAPTQPSTILVLLDGETEEQVLPVAKGKRKAFITSLGPTDIVLLEAGGQNGMFALAVARQGAIVKRLPTRFSKADREKLELGREDTAKVLMMAYQADPSRFLDYKEMSSEMAQLNYLLNSYYIIQDVRKAATNRIKAMYRDQELLEDVLGSVDVMNAILGSVNRRLFGVANPSKKKEDPNKALAKGKKTSLLDETVSAVLVAIEGPIETQIGHALEPLPVWQKVVSQIPQVGTITGARLITAIGDIRNFRSPAALKAYAGLHHAADGSAVRRQRGVVANWNPGLKQACYLFAEQVVGYASQGELWKVAFQRRLEYELGKISEAEVREEVVTYLQRVRDIDVEGKTKEKVAEAKAELWEQVPAKGRKELAQRLNSAKRWLKQKLLIHLYREWSRMEQEGDAYEYRLPRLNPGGNEAAS